MDGAPGADGANGAPGEPGLSSLLRTGYELAGAACAYGGVRIEVGLDADRDGSLDADEVDAASTQFLCERGPAWAELAALGPVTSVHGFALAVADDGSARLGFMFTDAAYQQALVNAGEIWNGGGVYAGPNTYVTYELTASGAAWDPYEGRLTPQTYNFSELVVSGGASYYTTTYPAFGGLVSVIRDGGTGVYALTPAFTTRKAHSIAIVPGLSDLYALIAQRNIGLTISRTPLTAFGNLSNLWTNRATLAASATAVAAPQLLVTDAGAVIAAYIDGAAASIRYIAAIDTLTAAEDAVEIGACEDAVLMDVAVQGDTLLVACVGGDDVLTVRSADLTAAPTVEWTAIETRVTGAIDWLDLEGDGTGASLAVRQGGALRVYAALDDARPAFDMVIAGEADLARSAQGLVLAVCDRQGDRVVRTFAE